ncbi:MAG: hypothetical protein GAK35_02618 [Herbaspirillum frisingense]|uniref:Uncharacterized protein n=1 Tax=Herbaspirillum frisingense TaxID=92645 RepID=A0A7V8JTZ4_9BURK|nr:MAG: hypothetical protein GAK35_02618 [Herbaspirillum frisingense]
MGKRKRKKAYRPRAENANAFQWAISGAYTLPLEKQRELVGYVDSSLARFYAGTATRDDWNVVANGMNISVALAYFKIGASVVDEINAGLDVLHAVARRMLSGQGPILTGGEVDAIRLGRDIYESQLAICSQAEAHRAVARVRDMHRSGGMTDMAKLYADMAAAPVLEAA